MSLDSTVASFEPPPGVPSLPKTAVIALGQENLELKTRFIEPESKPLEGNQLGEAKTEAERQNGRP